MEELAVLDITNPVDANVDASYWKDPYREQKSISHSDLCNFQKGWDYYVNQLKFPEPQNDAFRFGTCFDLAVFSPEKFINIPIINAKKLDGRKPAERAEKEIIAGALQYLDNNHIPYMYVSEYDNIQKGLKSLKNNSVTNRILFDPNIQREVQKEIYCGLADCSLLDSFENEEGEARMSILERFIRSVKEHLFRINFLKVSQLPEIFRNTILEDCEEDSNIEFILSNLKGKIDCIITDDKENKFIIDLKTTVKPITEVYELLTKYNYRQQSRFYHLLLSSQVEASKIDSRNWIFVTKDYNPISKFVTELATNPYLYAETVLEIIRFAYSINYQKDMKEVICL